MKAYIDMDGVVADFVAGALKVHNMIGNPYTASGAPKGDAAWNLITKIGITPEEFWAPMGYDFWRNLPKTKEADDLIGFLQTRFHASDMCFLTSPCNTNGCCDGKRDWVFEHFPGIPILFSQAARGGYPPKWFLSDPDSLLIDDHSMNIKQWDERGGRGLLFPRPWNNLYVEEVRAIEFTMEGVDHFCQQFVRIG